LVETRGGSLIGGACQGSGTTMRRRRSLETPIASSVLPGATTLRYMRTISRTAVGRPVTRRHIGAKGFDVRLVHAFWLQATASSHHSKHEQQIMTYQYTSLNMTRSSSLAVESFRGRVIGHTLLARSCKFPVSCLHRLNATSRYHDNNALVEQIV
jgi:hypothetical protein